MRRALFAAAAATVLALGWLGPLPRLAERQFSAHMTLHIAVVAIAAPLLALALAGSSADPTRVRPAWWSAVPLSIVELLVVWSWHAPALHHIARSSAAGLVAEQATFLLSAFLVWMAAFGAYPRLPRPPGEEFDGDRAAAGIVALLLTAIHMTLLGALIALAPRPLYGHEAVLQAPFLLTEQELGGTIMLLVGGAAYLWGALALAARLLRRAGADERSRRPIEHPEPR